MIWAMENGEFEYPNHGLSPNDPVASQVCLGYRCLKCRWNSNWHCRNATIWELWNAHELRLVQHWQQGKHCILSSQVKIVTHPFASAFTDTFACTWGGRHGLEDFRWCFNTSPKQPLKVQVMSKMPIQSLTLLEWLHMASFCLTFTPPCWQHARSILSSPASAMRWWLTLHPGERWKAWAAVSQPGMPLPPSLFSWDLSFQDVPGHLAAHQSRDHPIHPKDQTQLVQWVKNHQ